MVAAKTDVRVMIGVGGTFATLVVMGLFVFIVLYGYVTGRTEVCCPRRHPSLLIFSVFKTTLCFYTACLFTVVFILLVCVCVCVCACACVCVCVCLSLVLI